VTGESASEEERGHCQTRRVAQGSEGVRVGTSGRQGSDRVSLESERTVRLGGGKDEEGNHRRQEKRRENE